MLSFTFNYRTLPDLLDIREVPTQRHDGILFKESHIVHHKMKQNPFYRAILSWNNLPVHIRNIDQKELFKNTVLREIENPYYLLNSGDYLCLI